MQQRTAHPTHRCPRKPDLLWCMDTHPIIRAGVLCLFFFLLEENVIPIMIFPLTSTPLWLSASLLSSFLSALHSLCGHWGEANSGLIKEDGQMKWRRRETEREKEADGETSKERQNNNRIISAGSRKKKWDPATSDNLLQRHPTHE